MTDPDPRAWTVFDPNLRIDTHTVEGGNIVVVTHLPTGMQASCGQYTVQALNQNTAMAQLKNRVG